MADDLHDRGFWERMWKEVDDSMRRGDSYLVWEDGYTRLILYHYDYPDESYFEGEDGKEDSMNDNSLKALAEALPDLATTPPAREGWKPATYGPALAMTLPMRPAQPQPGMQPALPAFDTTVNTTINPAEASTPSRPSTNPNRPDLTGWVRAPFGKNTYYSRNVGKDPRGQVLATPAAYKEDLTLLGGRVRGKWQGGH
jgi:hypothetical protein